MSVCVSECVACVSVCVLKHVRAWSAGMRTGENDSRSLTR